MSICGGIAGSRWHNPKGIFIHNDAGTKNANASFYKNWLKSHDLSAGFAHYYVASDGMLQAEDDDKKAWHCGQTDGNNEYLAIEVCQSMGDLATFKSNEEKALQLAAQKCKQYGITPSTSTIRLHQEVSATACPHRSVEIHGGAAETKNYFISRIKELMKGEEDPDGDVKDNAGTFQVKKDQMGEVSYQGHLRYIGWSNWQCDGAMVGSTGQNRRIEALRIKPKGQMTVTAHIKDAGDRVYKNIAKDTVIGTTGKALRIEALKIESEDTQYRVRVHQKDLGWSAWAENGQWAGVKGKSKQVEAVEIKVIHFKAHGHVQDIGWQGWQPDGEIVGTTGKEKRLEALQIDPMGLTIKAKAHLQDDGWIDYGAITADTIIGSVGQKKRLECLCFDGAFEWRAHLAESGWTDWTKADGISTLGTVGQALRIEAIQFRPL